MKMINKQKDKELIDSFYFEKGVVIRLLGVDVYSIYPDNVENNIKALDKGDLKFDWEVLLAEAKKNTKYPTRNALEIYAFGELALRVASDSYSNLFSTLTSPYFSINWISILEKNNGKGMFIRNGTNIYSHMQSVWGKTNI